MGLERVLTLLKGLAFGGVATYIAVKATEAKNKAAESGNYNQYVEELYNYTLMQSVLLGAEGGYEIFKAIFIIPEQEKLLREYLLKR